jgi:transcriptional regulator with XRE-family HTH domain
MATVDARAFGAYIRLLRENFHGKGRGKGLRQLAREAGVAPSVLSRGERGLQDLRRVEYIERLAPYLGVRPSVLKRVAAVITPGDVDDLRRADAAASADLRQDGASRMLWGKVAGELERLRGAPPETLETLLAYIEYLASRPGRPGARGPAGSRPVQPERPQ